MHISSTVADTHERYLPRAFKRHAKFKNGSSKSNVRLARASKRKSQGNCPGSVHTPQTASKRCYQKGVYHTMATTIIIVTIASICAKYRIDEAQFSKATHCTSNGTNHYYIVESASEPGLEYHVRYSKKYNALSCTCKASDNGNGCWHRRASLASEEHFKAMQRARRLNEQAEVEASPQYQAEQFERACWELEQLQAELEVMQATA
jgi:hypothetical protein